MSNFIQNMKRALLAYSLSLNPSMMKILDLDYMRAVFNGEEEI